MNLPPCSLRLIVALLVAASLAACGGFKSGEDAVKTGDLTVRVADSRQPSGGLADASVSVTAGTTTKSGVTATDGTLRINGLPTGPATINATRDLFQPLTGTATVNGASVSNVTVLLQRRTGQVVATATDAFGAPVRSAQVQVSVEGQTLAGATDTNGAVTLIGVPTGTVPVAIVADGYLPEPSQTVTVPESPAATVSFALDRRTESAGGYVDAEPSPSVDGGQTLQFRMKLVVVDEQAQAIENLTAADFTLVACVDSTPARADCVRAPTDAAFDAAYEAVSPTPDPFLKVPGQAAVPYAGAVTLDQSGSIVNSDPTDARVFASKVFLDAVGPGDQVVLAAFADGVDARIPTTPLSIYGSFTNDGRSYFATLDQLASLEAGGTPLYAALDQLLQYTAQNAPANVPGQRKAVVLFTDGLDNVCADPVACREVSIDLSRTLGVDIFTVGLSAEVDTAALSELAYRGNGAFLVADNPEQLIAIYGSLGRLLGGNITTYEGTWTIRAGKTGVFVSGRSVLGKVQVTTAGRTLTIPFLYTIP